MLASIKAKSAFISALPWLRRLFGSSTTSGVIPPCCQRRALLPRPLSSPPRDHEVWNCPFQPKLIVLPFDPALFLPPLPLWQQERQGSLGMGQDRHTGGFFSPKPISRSSHTLLLHPRGGRGRRRLSGPSDMEWEAASLSLTSHGGGKWMFNPRFLRLGGLRRFGGYPTNRSRFWPWCLGLKSPLPHIPSRRHAQETQWKRLKDVFGAVAEISRGKFRLESQATPPSLLSPLSPRCCRRWP